jgi:uncharacterized membrane protein YccF (DUF307 family)
LPFAIAHLRLAGAALTPFGNEVVGIDEARRRGAANAVAIEPLGV